MRTFLENTFADFDQSLLAFWHSVAEWGGGFFTPLFRGLTFIGEYGLTMFLLAAVLLCFPRTRRIGVCVFGAVCCGALCTNIVLKDWIARPRPFLFSAEYAEWWEFLGAPAEEGFSFPSGHMTAATAGVGALLLTLKSKWKWVLTAYVALMACARNYLMAHYPSDVLGGVLVGAFSALVAWGITLAIYRFLQTYAAKSKLCRFALYFDIRHPKAWMEAA